VRTEGGTHTPFARVNALFRRIEIVWFHQPSAFNFLSPWRAFSGNSIQFDLRITRKILKRNYKLQNYLAKLSWILCKRLGGMCCKLHQGWDKPQ